ncbi:hypothetical protein F5Y01DRAFT_26593 [Xylaria sp. FL0043]|nr:hypothetical protein F5Y01DRAFT_26593 [Xylaria sp. FL0043]
MNPFNPTFISLLFIPLFFSSSTLFFVLFSAPVAISYWKKDAVYEMFSLLLISLLHSRAIAQSSDCGFIGGYPLRQSDSCPSDAPIACGVGLQPRCCPSGFACVADTSTGGTYCCESGTNCIADVDSHPQCPKPTWNVWAYVSNGSRGWCCEPNYYGFATLANDGVGCQRIGDTIDTDTYHTVTQFFTSSVVCTSSSTTSSPTATTTSTTSSSASPSLSGSTPSSSSMPKNRGSSLSAGGIAGVAIGAAAGVVLIAAVARLLIKRRAARIPAPVKSALPAPPKSPGYYAPDPPYEAPASSIVRYEMPVHANQGCQPNYFQQ